MQQYTVLNQAFLLTQDPAATDIRSFKNWKDAGDSVQKGDKAVGVWVPKTVGAAELEAERDRAAPQLLADWCAPVRIHLGD